MATCPYCKDEMTEPPAALKLTKRQRSVYEDIMSGGHDGYEMNKLMTRFYEGKNSVSLRTCIARINNIISPLKIRGRGKRYFIDST